MDDLTGRQLSKFRLVEKLGEGGMGVVYRAEDTVLRRQVAVKVLPDLMLHHPERRARFLREARSAAAVSHPNIATVHEIGETDGRVFIVMEYVRGETLRAVLERVRLPLGQALHYASLLASAVAQAHGSGVIHRDLKPENVMIDPQGQLKILDFGIAKIDETASGTAILPAMDPTAPHAAAPGPSELVTEEGRIVGTPGYMSPEQAMGRPVDYRTDLFSLGVMTYELVAGRRPFQGTTSMDVIVSTTRDEPPPASSLNPAVSPDLDGLLRHCMAKEPAHRLANASDLARHLTHFQSTTASQEAAPTAYAAPPPAISTTEAGTLVAPPAAPPGPPPARRGGRGLLVAALGVTGLLGLLVVGAGVYALTAHGDDLRALAGGEVRQPAVGLAAIDQYLSPKDSRASNSSSRAFWETAEHDFAEAVSQPNAPRRWTAARDFCAGNKELTDGNLDAAQRYFDQSRTTDPKWAVPLLGVASVAMRRGEFDLALESARNAQLLEPELVAAMAATGRAYAAKNEYPEAILAYRRGLQAAPDSSFLMAELALSYHASNMDAQAERWARQALALDPELVSARVLLAERALEDGTTTEAIEHANRAIGTNPTSVSAWLVKGDALLVQGDRDEARDALARAVRLWRKTKRFGAPEARLSVVAEALDAGELPPARGAASTASRSRPSPRAAPPSRSPPRSALPTGTTRTRSTRGGGSPSGRSDPLGGLDDF